MSIADKITSIETHLEADYEGLENIGADLTGINKNILNIRTILDTIYNDMPKVTGEGTEVTLTPTRKGRLALIPKGNSTQDTRDGKNLLAIPDVAETTINGITYSITNGVLTINGTTIISRIIIFCELISPIQFSNGTNYVMSAVLDGTLEGGNISLGVYNATTDDTSVFGRQQNQFPITSNTIEGTANYLGGYIAYGRKFTNYKIKLQIEEGTTPTTWQQGGATPSPSIPSPIKSVTGENEVVVEGKNILNLSNDNVIYSTAKAYSVNNGIVDITIGDSSSSSFILIDLGSIENYRGKTLTLSALENGGVLRYCGFVNCNASGGNRTEIGNSFGNTNTSTTYTIDGTYTQTNLAVRLSVYGTAGTTYQIKKPQVEYGSTATTYMPYVTPQTKPLNLGTKKVMLGDSMQDDGIHHVRIRERINTDNFRLTFDSSNNIFYIRKLNSSVFYKTINGLCTHFKNAMKTNITQNSNAFSNLNDNEFNFRNGTMDRCYFKNTTFTTEQDWLDFFTNNEVYIEYELLEETTEAYTETQQAQYDDIQKMKSYEGTTIITSTFDSNNAQMIISASALKGE